MDVDNSKKVGVTNLEVPKTLRDNENHNNGEMLHNVENADTQPKDDDVTQKGMMVDGNLRVDEMLHNVSQHNDVNIQRDTTVLDIEAIIPQEKAFSQQQSDEYLADPRPILGFVNYHHGKEILEVVLHPKVMNP